jgi:dinuclear metal center YbgI/SA1388 family protein
MGMKIQEITDVLEAIAPLAFQEDYDNSGLICGDPSGEVSAAMVSLDLTPVVIREAIEKKCGLVISHHPFIFRGIRKLVAGGPEYEVLRDAMRHGISLYAIHTNLDNSFNGLNKYVCEKLGLKNCRVLAPKKGMLRKLVTFCPVDHAAKVRNALFEAGAGHIGNYESCSYNVEGTGTFKASDKANPFVGERNKLHTEPEVRVEVIFPAYLEAALLRALRSAHPYEEVAFDIYPLENEFAWAGAGMTGLMDPALPVLDFLQKVRQILRVPLIRHTGPVRELVSKVAVCTGSGSFLIPEAARAGADIFITGDLKYHDFQGAVGDMMLADIGHYESEQWVKELIYEVLIQKFPTFAVLISEKEENPVKYL